MKYWIIRHLPIWVLKLLKKYDWTYLELYCRYDHRLDCGCNCDPLVGENCEECNPVGVPEWLANESESYGYKDEPDVKKRGNHCIIKEGYKEFFVWTYHPDIMSRVGEKVLQHGKIYDITKSGLVRYRGEDD